MNNKTEKKLKYISSDMTNLNTRLNDLNDLTEKNTKLSIDRGQSTTQKNTNINNLLLSRQITPVSLRNTENDIKLNNTEQCDKQLRNYDISKVYGHNELNESNLNIGMLLSDDDMKKIQEKYNNSCNVQKKEFSWANRNVQLPNTHINGFGNPYNYHLTHVGMDTRLNNDNNPRNMDMSRYSMIPSETFRINYANLQYEQDSRGGISTRTSKRINYKNQIINT